MLACAGTGGAKRCTGMGALLHLLAPGDRCNTLAASPPSRLLHTTHATTSPVARHPPPRSDLFSKHQRPMVITSDVCLAAMYALLLGAMAMFGGGLVAKLYWWALLG